MNKYDACKVLGIEESTVTQEIVKKAYHKACFKFHPDHNPAGANMMKLVNEAKSSLDELGYPLEVNSTDSYNYGDEINEALNKIITLDGIIIEVCGSWIWVSGETKKHKDSLGSANFIYSGKKVMWYFRPKSQIRFRGSKKLSMDEIRNKYKSQRISTKERFLSAQA